MARLTHRAASTYPGGVNRATSCLTLSGHVASRRGREGGRKPKNCCRQASTGVDRRRQASTGVDKRRQASTSVDRRRQ
eukprot:5233905-Pleurochrysis_carterae.AAC.1